MWAAWEQAFSFLQPGGGLFDPMRSSQPYSPLDVETDPSPASTGALQGWDAPRQETPADRARARRTAAALGGVFLLLVVLAAVTSSPQAQKQQQQPGLQQQQEQQRQQPGGAAAGVWSEHGAGTAAARDHAAAAAAAAAAAPRPNAAGWVPCDSPSDLECGFSAAAAAGAAAGSGDGGRPAPDVDFRGLPRRLEAAGGVVAADSSRCSEIGAAALDEGGHAVDAAVATALCLGVVNPISSGLGGGAFILVRLANGSSEFINAREPAPAGASATMFDDLPASASLDGGLSVAVPCELRGLEAAWRRYGRLPWARLVAPAARLARSGFAAHPYLVYSLTGPFNLQRVKSTPALREAFLIPAANGTGWRVPAPGERCCRRPKLADTLENIARHGAGWLYSEEVAGKLAAEVQAAGGIVTAGDIINVAPVITEPMTTRLGPLELTFPPPPSSAAVVAFALKFLAGYGDTVLGDVTGGAGDATGDGAAAAAAAGRRRLRGAAAGASGAKRARPSFGVDPKRDAGLGLQRLIEAQKHGFAVRTALGDPGTPDAPFELASEVWAAAKDLLDDGFIDGLRAETRDKGVLPPEEYGGRWNPVKKDRAAPPDDHGTTHFCVVDGDRNAVSVTSTVNTVFGSAVVSESTGIIFNNEMDDFSQPKRTSLVTPHPSPANFIAPGKRPLSAMSPIVATDAATGRLVAVAGGSGGPLIVSATLQALARLLLEGSDISDAIAAARLHDQLLPLPTKSFFENHTWAPVHELPPSVVASLEARGQSLEGQHYGLGVSQAIAVRYPDSDSDSEASAGGGVGEAAAAGAKGMLVAMSDARKDGAPRASRARGGAAGP